MNTKKNILSYVRLQEEEYILSLSLEEALKEGFKADEYEELFQSLNETNTAIAEFKRTNPDDKIIYHDPQENLQERNSNLRAPGPYGDLSTDDQQPRGTGFWAPAYYNIVEFKCKGKAAQFPLLKCQAKSTFGGWITHTEVGRPLTLTTITINLYTSNDSVDIVFSTSDSNGGYCHWECKFNY